MLRRKSACVTLGAAGVAAALIAGGAYDVSADVPHWKLTASLLGVIRDRSVAVRAANVDVPDLSDPMMVSTGAAHYAAMCAGCHLAPGTGDTELRRGLYPVPPDLTEGTRPPAESFQIIKHGIKMSAMPAWGVTHDDASIWALVSFLEVLPSMDARAYASLASEAGGHDHAEHGHEGGTAGPDTSGPAQEQAGEAGPQERAPHVHSADEAHH